MCLWQLSLEERRSDTLFRWWLQHGRHRLVQVRVSCVEYESHRATVAGKIPTGVAASRGGEPSHADGKRLAQRFPLSAGPSTAP